MSRNLFSFTILLWWAVGQAAPTSQLTQQEQQEIQQRLNRVYGNLGQQQNVQVMNERVPKWKWNLEQQKWVAIPALQSKPYLRTSQRFTHPLQQQAQLKATPGFQRKYCETVLQKRFPGKIRCNAQGGRAVAQSNDKVEDLVSSYLSRNEIIRDLKDDDAKSNAKTRLDLWSDDYWRLKFGATSFRYAHYNSSSSPFRNWQDAIRRHPQPAEWTGLVSGLPGNLNTALQTIDKWAPSEKYDLLMGDQRFTLTHSQKGTASTSNNEEWMGICHGWAPAAIVVPKPKKAVTRLTGARDIEITMYPAEIKALASLQYAEGNYSSNFVGGRCNASNPRTYPNGRVIQQECFDNNPATFHLSNVNMIGKLGYSYVMDKTWDSEVWNQPIDSYQYIYFNPVNRNVQSTNFKQDWQKLVVSVNDPAFKQVDRFQKSGMVTRDLRAKYVVGVIATIGYVEEVTPEWGDVAGHDSIARATYTYDLELNDRFEPTGGEWHSNAHPDFLWVPEKGSNPRHPQDRNVRSYNGTPRGVTNVAISASRDNYPLGAVVDYLVDKSK